MTTVLISGASIAGPALGYWLRRYGFEVTIVERAQALRGGGYPIDLRGTAVEVADRMGILPRLREARVDVRKLTFLDPAGEPITSVSPQELAGGDKEHDIEIPRGDLANALFDITRDSVEYLFGDSIETFDQHDDGVDVTFRSGTRRRFDLVVGADGLHSRTRELLFGPEAPFHRYLEYCFAGFTVPNELGLSQEGVAWNAAGRTAVLYAPREQGDVHGFLTFLREDPPFDAFADPAAQRDLVASMFPEQVWQLPNLVARMRTADDLFFDVVSQIHLPRWSSGRVALVGDAAYAPSFFSGQGSSIALVGAYLLAGELASRDDHAKAFTAYEEAARDFVNRNQALALGGSGALSPRTEEALAARNEALRAGTLGTPEERDDVYNGLVLPDYPA
ncbi:2-polyprenyl-6-methoxyphenol hydroxylase [Amycolatopsis sacchari]|uniref:2-polyprenyl-6-methoxyphenol hydroxylase n=1 Tax=Amycolatopsis sacchari TaxID=115433 RepID=A0A1I3ZNI8_9PSEU|nr:FAD-dependent monooxygenase [Amycolatopsis sacchari]SFK45635.1 2-polyprenyl-6-methoxyphenol hydroxylase [Amycolatopsis sacchari]